MDRWQNHRSELRRRWWTYMAVAFIGTAVFLWGLNTRDSVMFSILLLIPLLALRQAWRIDRQIRSTEPTIVKKEIS